MSSPTCVAPPALAEFEFAPLERARNYRKALIHEFAPFLKGSVLEVGAGVGHITQNLTEIATVKRVVALEPAVEFRPHLRKILPDDCILHGTIDAVRGEDWDAIVCVNVLEHIEKDERELQEYRARLQRKGGHLCLFVPARPELYALIDRDFGHFRRYVRPELKEKLERAGFDIVRLTYFNWVGYFIWWLNFKMLKNRRFDTGKIVLFDRFIFPVVHSFESRVVRPPFGQSLLAIGQARPSL